MQTRDGQTQDGQGREGRGRDEQAVSTFIERFASVLGDTGFPRMPARIFTALLATDSGRLTAAELAELLQVSPAAVSGAVRYLIQLNLVSRERDPGSRRDRYRVHDDVWYEASVRRDQMLVRWESSLREGIAALGADSPAGARLAESLEFFEFVRGELPTLLARWHTRRAELRTGRER
ncbi:GbsR/MarR family transcriptional regulator [Kitasatospora sp. NPDC056138]|uniref:GbsR/MarR family transcriptional regulator n=1 Tax=Kitasatospora sp. NPDC056138 TaxID=3345724 RepID=UPI0035D8AA5A